MRAEPCPHTLPRQRQPLSQRCRLHKEDLAQPCQALVAHVVAAIEPLVVARRVQHRRRQAIELRAPPQQAVVSAHLLWRTQVAVVHDQGRRLPPDVREQRRQLRLVVDLAKALAVPDVADHRDAQGGFGRHRQGQRQ